ncbi:MAG: hypothetical protein AAGD22_10960 [Verrucomicrobiota bacterium]
MNVLLLTIFGSLLLAAVFVIAFAAERGSRSMSAPNPERDALLPFDDEPANPSKHSSNDSPTVSSRSPKSP